MENNTDKKPEGKDPKVETEKKKVDKKVLDAASQVKEKQLSNRETVNK